MSATPLERALDWWIRQDDMGGFKTVAAMIFPGWELKRNPRAPHREDKSPSFSIYRNERGEWRFKDQATGEQGGLVGFVMLAGMDEKQAARWLMDKAGMTPGNTIAYPTKPKPAGDAGEAENLHEMPVESMAMWNEGVDYLQAKLEHVEGLAAFRGWPVEWAQYLIDCAVVSMPLYHGHRTIAFLVSAPEGVGHGIAMRDVGIHCRLKPFDKGEKAQWRFVPNESEHKQSTPAFPFIIGGSWFNTSRLLIILEGQWDTLTFAFAAGWLGDGCSWPKGVCVLGSRM